MAHGADFGAHSRAYLDYEKAAFRMEILIRQSGKATKGELDEAFQNIFEKYEKLSIGDRRRLNRFSLPQSFKERVSEIN